MRIIFIIIAIFFTRNFISSDALYDIVSSDNLGLFQEYVNESGGWKKFVRDNPKVFYASIRLSDTSEISSWILDQGYSEKRLLDREFNYLQNALHYGKFSLAMKLLTIWNTEGYFNPKLTDESTGRNYLHIAFQSDNKTPTIILESLLNAGVPLNQEDNYGRTPIYYAITDNNTEATDLLIKRGAFLDDPSYLRLSVTGSSDLVQLLLNRGIHPDKRPEHKETALFLIFDKEYFNNENLHLLLKNGANPNFHDLYNKRTALHLITRISGRETPPYEAINLILKYGADLNIQDYHGYTPLHMLFDYNPYNTELAELYISLKPNLNLKNRYGNQPLHFAVGKGVTTTTIITKMIEAGADINAQNDNGDTPLLLAINDEIINILLEFGADPNIPNKDGFTLLMKMVCRNYDPNILKLISSMSKDINVQDRKGRTPLHYVLDYDNTDFITPLISNGASLKIKDYNGNLPIHYAVSNDDITIEQLDIILNKSDINALNLKGETPLHILLDDWLYDRGDVRKRLPILLKRGAYVNIRDKNKLSPILTNAAVLDREIYNILVENGADITHRDENRNTVLHRYAMNRVDNHRSGSLNEDIFNMKGLINSTNNIKNTPLHLALKEGNIETAMILLEEGANPWLKNGQGKIPLDYIIEDQDVIKNVVNNSQAHEYFSNLKGFSRKYKVAASEYKRKSKSSIGIIELLLGIIFYKADN